MSNPIYIVDVFAIHKSGQVLEHEQKTNNNQVAVQVFFQAYHSNKGERYRAAARPLGSVPVWFTSEHKHVMDAHVIQKRASYVDKLQQMVAKG